MLTFLLFLYLLSLLAVKEGALRVEVLGIGFGLLFALLGNYMPKLPRNWFFGIRNPWTLSSETVWRKTQIFGGWLFVLSGLAIIVCSLLKINPFIPLFGALLVILPLAGILYPFRLFKKLEREGQAPVPEL